MLGGDAQRVMCPLTYYLVPLSSELFTTPESGKIIIRTDSCLLFKKQATKCISSRVAITGQITGQLSKEDSVKLSLGHLKSPISGGLNQ